MADVYQAEDLILQRDVAVKVLAALVADDSGYADRFRAEAHRLASFSHPNLVPVYYSGEAELQGEQLLFLVMPLLRESLRDLRRREGKLASAPACRLIVQVADGLESVHRRGIVHRDVKPGNILLDMEGRPLLADFGIACELWADSLAQPSDPNELVVGTPEYMAPEQLCGDPIDQRADVYALGAVFYELLTGRPPFVGATAHDVAVHALYAPLIPPSMLVSGVDPAVEQVVLTALARDPGERYATAGGFAMALRNSFIGRHATPGRRDLVLQPRRLAPPAGWDSDATVPAQFPEEVQNRRRLENILQWRRLWPLVLAAMLLFLILAAGHLFASGLYSTGPRVGTVPIIRAPAPSEQTPTRTIPSTTGPPTTKILSTDEMSTKGKPHGKHHGEGPEADHNGDRPEADQHSDGQEDNHQGDRPNHHSDRSNDHSDGFSHPHSHSKSM
jgi:serine/threonine-protein kinase